MERCHACARVEVKPEGGIGATMEASFTRNKRSARLPPAEQLARLVSKSGKEKKEKPQGFARLSEGGESALLQLLNSASAIDFLQAHSINAASAFPNLRLCRCELKPQSGSRVAGRHSNGPIE